MLRRKRSLEIPTQPDPLLPLPLRLTLPRPVRAVSSTGVTSPPSSAFPRVRSPSPSPRAPAPGSDGKTSRCAAETLSALSAFRKRANDARIHNNALKEHKSEIDFEHYRQILKNKEIVAEGEKIFKSFKAVDYDVQGQLKTIAAFEGKAVRPGAGLGRSSEELAGPRALDVGARRRGARRRRAREREQRRARRKAHDGESKEETDVADALHRLSPPRSPRPRSRPNSETSTLPSRTLRMPGRSTSSLCVTPSSACPVACES